MTGLPTTGVREYVPGNLGQSDRVIQFPVRQRPSVGSDPGTVELKLEPTVKIGPQNPIFRFTHRGGPYQHPKCSCNVLIVITKLCYAVVKS